MQDELKEEDGNESTFETTGQDELSYISDARKIAAELSLIKETVTELTEILNAVQESMDQAQKPNHKQTLLQSKELAKQLIVQFEKEVIQKVETACNKISEVSRLASHKLEKGKKRRLRRGALIFGGAGDDHLFGASDNDVLSGGPGKDFFDCNEGFDRVLDFNPDEDTANPNCEIL